MTSKILEELADIEIAHPEDVKDESECQFNYCSKYGNLLRCYMDLKFREKCVFYIQFIKSGRMEK